MSDVLNFSVGYSPNRGPTFREFEKFLYGAFCLWMTRRGCLVWSRVIWKLSVCRSSLIRLWRCGVRWLAASSLSLSASMVMRQGSWSGRLRTMWASGRLKRALGIWLLLEKVRKLLRSMVTPPKVRWSETTQYFVLNTRG